MSDYARTSIAFPVGDGSVTEVLSKVADFFDRDGRSPLLHDPAAPPGAQAVFRPIDETPEKYQTPAWLETREPEPENRTTLLRLAGQHKNLAVHTTFDFAGKAYSGTIYIYTIAAAPGRRGSPQTFTRISFQSTLTYVLRGTEEFGGPVTIDRDVKAGILETALGLTRVLDTKGFLYGLEGDGPWPFTLQQLAAYLQNPIGHQSPMPLFMAGIDGSILPRAEMISVWGDETAVKQTTSGLVLLDLLVDSEGELDDEADE